MDTSQFIARLLAVIYLSVGIGMMMNPAYYRRMLEELTANAVVLYLGGAMALAFGFTIVSFHNHWEAHWSVLITIFGWLAVLKGIGCLVFPDHMILISRKWAASMLRFAWIMAIVFGLVFGYFGFVY